MTKKPEIHSLAPEVNLLNAAHSWLDILFSPTNGTLQTIQIGESRHEFPEIDLFKRRQTWESMGVDREAPQFTDETQFLNAQLTAIAHFLRRVTRLNYGPTIREKGQKENVVAIFATGDKEQIREKLGPIAPPNSDILIEASQKILDWWKANKNGN